MQITPVPQPVASRLSNTLQDASVRFQSGIEQQTPVSHRKPLPLERWVKLAAYLYTHPKVLLQLEKNLLPKGTSIFNRLMPDKHLPLFHPLIPVRFKTVDQLQLLGYRMPSTMPSDKTIIMGHGYFQNWREMLGVAQHFRKQGFNILLFDFRAHGDSEGSQTSIGFHEGKDIAAAVRFVSRDYPAESKTLFYMGHSMGASAILMTPRSLEKHPEELKLLEDRLEAIVADCPFSNLSDMTRRFVENMDEVANHKKAVQTLLPLVRKYGGNVLKDLLQTFDAVGHEYLGIDTPLQNVKPAEMFLHSSKLAQKPVLVLHGDADPVTPFKQGLEVYETIRRINSQTRMTVLKGAGHLDGNWDPAGNGERYVSALRNEEVFIRDIINFFNTIAEKESLQVS